jgi:hypothetical protein
MIVSVGLSGLMVNRSLVKEPRISETSADPQHPFR